MSCNNEGWWEATVGEREGLTAIGGREVGS